MPSVGAGRLRQQSRASSPLTVVLAMLLFLSTVPWCSLAAGWTEPYDEDWTDNHGEAVGLRDGAHGRLFPRYYIDSTLPRLFQRDDIICPANDHSCLDIESSLCCPNDYYCVVNETNWQPACCPIGSSCGLSCNTTQFKCNATITDTLAVTVTTTAAAATAVLVTMTVTTTTTSVVAACCPRSCPGTSMFLCASSLGNGCCSFGQTCGANSQCVGTAAAAPSSSSSLTGGAGGAAGSGATTPIAGGCPAGRVACPSSLGAGCCSAGHSCTLLSGQLFCAQQTLTPTASGIVVVTNGPGTGSGTGHLSGGAKAGLALGIVVAAAAIFAAAAWLWRHQRRRRRINALRRQRREEEQPPPPAALAPFPAVPGADNSDALDAFPDLRPPRPFADGEATSWSGSGLAQDYYGPNAVRGPFTDPETPLAASGPASSGANNAAYYRRHHQAMLDLGAAHGVPMVPQGPHDIVGPVEIDSTGREPVGANELAGDAGAGAMAPVGSPPHGMLLDPNDEKGEVERQVYSSPVAQSSQAFQQPQYLQTLPASHANKTMTPDNGPRLFELYGSEALAPPAEKEQQQQQRQQQNQPPQSPSSTPSLPAASATSPTLPSPLASHPLPSPPLPLPSPPELEPSLSQLRPREDDIHHTSAAEPSGPSQHDAAPAVLNTADDGAAMPTSTDAPQRPPD